MVKLHKSLIDLHQIIEKHLIFKYLPKIHIFIRYLNFLSSGKSYFILFGEKEKTLDSEFINTFSNYSNFLILVLNILDTLCSFIHQKYF